MVPRIRSVSAICVCLGVALGSTNAMASPDEEDVLRLNAGGGIAYDDNVFKLSSSADPESLLGSSQKSDQIRSIYAGISINKPVGIQRFRLNATLNHVDYNRFNFLDYDAKNLSGLWEWAVGSRWKGDLGYERTQTLNDFLDTRSFVKNIRTEQNTRFTADYWLQAAWHAKFAAANLKSTNSLPIRADSDIEIKTVAAGVRYEASPGDFLEGLLRHGHGNYFNSLASAASQTDNNFDDNEFELKGQWAVTGKSKVSALAKYVDWKYPTFSIRNFSGWAGRVEHNWSITDKTALKTAFDHDLYPYIETVGTDSGGASYVVGNRLSLAPEWKATSKITLRAMLARALRDFRGQVSGGVPRHDALNTASLTLEYQPARVVRLSTYIQWMERSGNFDAFNFSDRVVGLNADFSF